MLHSTLDGALEHSFLVWVAEDLVDVELAGVAVLSNYGPKISSSKV